MKRYVWVLGVCALVAPLVHAQHGSHAGHEPRKASPAKPASAPAAAGGTFQSAFKGYRPFNAEEPLKDWRAANEEVRAAGGHVGLMKAAAPDAKSPGEGPHEHHGKKQP